MTPSQLTIPADVPADLRAELLSMPLDLAEQVLVARAARAESLAAGAESARVVRRARPVYARLRALPDTLGAEIDEAMSAIRGAT